MKKALKIVGILALCLVALVVAAVLALPLWIEPVAKGVSEAVVPQITGTRFKLGEFGLNPYYGTLHVGMMRLANPTNFSEKYAIKLDKFDADLAMTSLFSGKKVRVESVELDGLVLYSNPTASNFRQIAAHAAGEPPEDDRSEVAKLADENAPKPEVEEEPEQAKTGGKGVQIDKITIKNVTFKYGIVPVKIPMDIELTDIGKDSEEGASLLDVIQMIYDKIKSCASAVTDAVTDTVTDIGKGAVDAVGSAADALTSGNVDAAKDTLKDAGKGVKGALKGVGSGLGDAAKSVDLKKAGDGIKDLFK
jgi:hypothetical protein